MGSSVMAAVDDPLAETGYNYISGADVGRIIVGTAGMDDIDLDLAAHGPPSADPVFIDAGDGDDVIWFDAFSYTGPAPSDVLLRGGAGDDRFYVFGALAGVRLEGGEGDDVFNVRQANDLIFGGAGLDTVSYIYLTTGAVSVDLSLTGAQDTGGGGIDTIVGVENLEGSEWADDLRGDAGANRIGGWRGDDLILGAGGDDVLLGEAGADRLYGEAGDDRLVGGEGDDLLDGGDGDHDVADYSDATTAITVDLSRIDAQDFGSSLGQDQLNGIEGFWAGAGDDHLIGDARANDLRGGAGSDHLEGGDGDDLLTGGDGPDVLDGGAGTDTASFAGSLQGMTIDLEESVAYGDPPIYLPGVGWVGPRDTLISIEGVIGSSHNDEITLDGGDNVVDGGDGVDTVSYGNATQGVTVDLGLSGAQDTGAGQDTLLDVEDIAGSAFDDVLTGDEGANGFEGGDGQDWLITKGGSDVLTGGDGHDSLWGGDGDDWIEGGLGDDTLFGGEGTDTASYADAASYVVVNLSIQEEQNTRAGGVDTLVSIENLVGSAYADVLIGDHRDNIIAPGETRWGGDNSRLVGDVLTGGGGDDTFVFVNAMTNPVFDASITDFSVGDRIDLSMFDFDLYAPGRQGLHFGTAAGATGSVTVEYNAAGGYSAVIIDLGEETRTIYVRGEHLQLTAGDFIF